MADCQSKYEQALATLNNVCLVMLIASFQFNRWLLFSISLICFGVSFLAEYLFLRGWKGWRWRRSDVWFAALVMLWLVFPLSLPLTGGGPEFKHEMEKNLSFLLIGAMGLLHSPRKASVRVAAWAFIITSVVINIAILCLTNWHDMLTNPQHLMAIEEARYEHFSAHMRYNLCQNMALLSAAYIMFKSPSRSERTIAAITAPFILIMTFTSQGRVGIVTAIVLTTGIIILSLRGRARLLAALAAIVALAAGAFFMQGMQKMQEYDKLSEEIIQDEPRVKLWSAAWAVISEHPMGQGVDKGVEDFRQKCCEKNTLCDTHTHNLWLQFSLYFGLIGFLLITAVMLLPPFVIEGEKRLLIIFALLPFLLEGFVDVFGAGIVPMLFLIPMWVIIES